MEIGNEFTVRVPIDEAWKVLTDLEGIAPAPEPEPRDLLAVAGSSVTRRLIAIVAIIVGVVAVIGYRLRKR